MIAIGTHRAIAQSIQFGHAGQDDKEQVAIEFRLIDEADPDVGQSITYFGFFTEKTFHRTIESLRYCGWTGDDLAELPSLAEGNMLTGEVDLVIDHEEYEGAWRAKVKWVNRPGGGKLTLSKPMEAGSLSTFAARMKSSIRAADSQPRQRAGGPAQQQRSGGGGRQGFGGDNRNVPPPADDDLPFDRAPGR